jgi:hypothetical protein
LVQRITPSEKEALSKARAEYAAITKRINEYIRQNNARNGAAIALARERALAELETVSLPFYEGRITRGEYNKKRRAISQQLQEQLRVVPLIDDADATDRLRSAARLPRSSSK